MKKAKVLSLTLVLAMLIGIFSIVPSVGAVSNDPVKLIYAKPAYTASGIAATGYVEVENIAYAKNVTIHYSFDGSNWYDCAAEYYKPTWGNREAWKFTTQGTERPGHVNPVTITFAIKYEVNGQTYWDNNNHQNYYVYSGYHATDLYDFGVGGLANYHASIYDNSINGELQLKNLAYEKDVKVIYTTDNWQTTNEVDAEYNYTYFVRDDIEIWKYSIPSTDSNLQYKLSYTVNGVTYVDDNFGEYYTSEFFG